MNNLEIRMPNLLRVVPEEDRERQQATETEAHRRWSAEHGVPARLVDVDLETSIQTPAVVAMLAFLKDDAPCGRALVLSSDPGPGKSYAMAGAINRQRGKRSAWFENVDRFVRDALRDTRVEAMNRVEMPELLCLDDLGRQRLSDFALSSIEEVLTYRYEQLLPTIVSTNWTAVELKKHLSPRMIDRLREWCTIVTLTGSSLRDRPVPAWAS